MDSYRKGQDVVIKTLKNIIDNGYKAKLTFIGDGEKREQFELLVNKYNLSDNVEFKGLIKDKKILINELRNSHFMIFPTQSEGLPRTIIEAMSQGLVCISSPVDGIPELLEDEFLIHYNDVKQYANKVIELMNNWEKCCIESNKNYEKAKKYEKCKLDKKREQFYKKMRMEVLK